MGTSWDGVCFYGMVFANEDGEGWPEATLKVLGEDDDIEDWLARYLEVPERKGYSSEENRRWREAREAACLRVFGVLDFESQWLGHIDYPTWAVHPKGAQVATEYGGGLVPSWPAEQVEVWRVACERLAAVLPGAGPIGLHYGCSGG